jgi:predicted dehydrogenase
MELNYLPRLPVNKDMRIGCIGSGFIMADCQLVAYKQNGFNPVAISGRTKANTPKSCRSVTTSLSSYDTYQQLLADPEIEIVDIAVPPHIQLEVIREAVNMQIISKHSGSKAEWD